MRKSVGRYGAAHLSGEAPNVQLARWPLPRAAINRLNNRAEPATSDNARKLRANVYLAAAATAAHCAIGAAKADPGKHSAIGSDTGISL